MIFGDRETFAIEIGAIRSFPNAPGSFVHIRFWIGNEAIGDWDDFVPLDPSVETARTIIATAEMRRKSMFGSTPSAEVFHQTYDAFYVDDDNSNPNLRDRFHLDDIGMGAVQDKYGLVLVGATCDVERVIVKDFRSNRIISDVSMPMGFAELVAGAEPHLQGKLAISP